MNKSICCTIILIAFLGFLLTTGCKHEYQRTVEKELASGERNDSIFLDIHFGMHRKDFFEHCWEMNKKGWIRQGDKNLTVQFDMFIKDKKTLVDFYPDFHQDRIYQMPVTYRYFGWSPWIKELSSDILLQEILKIYKNTYGDNFIEVERDKVGKAFVQVDGNRRISIYKKGEQNVRVIFTDLSVESKMPKVRQVANEQQLPVWMKEAKKE